jgi:hypothetical protein
MWDRFDHSRQPLPSFPFTVISPSEEDQAWALSPCQGQEPGIVQIGRDHYSLLIPGALQNRRIRSTLQFHLDNMNCLVTLPHKPSSQLGRERHVNEEPHRENSTVSSSAK